MGDPNATKTQCQLAHQVLGMTMRNPVNVIRDAIIAAGATFEDIDNDETNTISYKNLVHLVREGELLSVAFPTVKEAWEAAGYKGAEGEYEMQLVMDQYAGPIGELDRTEFQTFMDNIPPQHQPQANMAALEALFGSEILTKEGPQPTAEALAGKTHIMVYFSAHWCPPCRGYTPELSKAYADSGKKDQTAVVFVSSDRDEAAFAEYYGEMSFMALPFANRSAKEELSTKYGVRGIPTLVLLDGDGNLVEGNIRGQHATYL